MCAICCSGQFECEVIATLLHAQHGVLHASQLGFYGYNPTARSRLSRERGWKRILPGVYVARPPDPDELWLQRLQAALLFIPRGVVSGRAAAIVHGLDGIRSAPVEISAPKLVRRKKWLVVHRAPQLRVDDVVQIDGMRVTSVNRTIIDLASLVSEKALARAFDSAWRRGWTSPDELREELHGRARKA